MTSGTADVFGPFETDRVTVDPGTTELPDCGLWVTTVSAGWFDSTSLRATANPAACSCELAVAKLEPTTFGTATGCGPFETCSVTSDPWSTDAPAVGVWPITVPVCLSEVTWMTFAFSFASASRPTASVDDTPRTLGTVVFGLPLDA